MKETTGAILFVVRLRPGQRVANREAGEEAVNRRAKLTLDRRPMLTPLVVRDGDLQQSVTRRCLHRHGFDRG